MNAVGVAISGAKGESISFLSFINIDNWVRVLLLFYLFFWLIYRALPKIIGGRYWQDCAICVLICLYSLSERLFHCTWGWSVETLGFAYGIIASNYGEQIKKWMKKKWITKILGLMLISSILGITYLRFKTVAFAGDYLLKIALGIAITAFIFTVLYRVKVGNRANWFLSVISYEVYLVHGVAFELIRFFDRSRMNSGVYIIVSVVISLALAWCVKSICKPVIKRITSIRSNVL